MTRCPRALLVLGLAGATALAGCTGGSDSAPRDPATRAESAPPSPSVTATPPEQALARLGAEGVAAEFTATYALEAPGRTGPGRPDATVTIHRRGPSYRLDVRRSGARSVLLTARQGLVACQLDGSRRTCLVVAKRGQDPPRVFDPGLQRLFTTAPRAFATGRGLTVTDAGVLPVSGDRPGARCFRVEGRRVDRGEYCLTASGVLRRAQFGASTLDLVRLTGPPDDAVFEPPAEPQPLPR